MLTYETKTSFRQFNYRMIKTKNLNNLFPDQLINNNMLDSRLVNYITSVSYEKLIDVNIHKLLGKSI